ncbi:MAG: tail fiber domain-containing protein [Gammaproteobacteria bacterium]|nr:MAG: tail fiber domain-containing protein [Gammaproteobacteria bacterium]TLZ05568.1 MAG: tail fiber domain-containing protein [Gammaproteobacteria bacterium]TLZ40075.1 MAG: tail fiber domain-containing protein [Gammaproteobacteria bacterium]
MEKMRQWRYGAEALQPESHAFGPEQRINLGHGGEPAGGPQSRRARGHCNPGNVLQQCVGVRMKKVLLLLALWPVFALGQVLNNITLNSPVNFVGSSTQSYPMSFIGSSVDPNASNFGIGIGVYTGVNYNNARADTVMTAGYNFAGGNQKLNPAEPTVGMVVEDFYIPIGTSVAQTELHLDSTDITGNEHRWFTAYEAVDGSDGAVELNGNKIVFNNNSNTNNFPASSNPIQFNLASSPASMAMNNTYIGFLTNNLPVMRQINAAGNAWLNLPYINASNQLTLPGTVYIPGTVIFNGSLSRASFSDDTLFNTGTAIFGTGQSIRVGNNEAAFNSTAYIAWSLDSHSYDTQDTSLSRGAAGVVYVGNGRQGSTAGSMVMKNLTASGTITFSGVKTGTNTDFVCMSAGGVLTLQTSACTISSLRFKENVEDMEGSAEPSINKMRVASFQMKDTNNKDPNARSKQIGLIAENIAEVAPECAIYEDDMKTPKSYRQECVIGLLVKAIQEQAKEIAELKARH